MKGKDNRVYQNRDLYRIYCKQIELMRSRKIYTKWEAVGESE